MTETFLEELPFDQLTVPACEAPPSIEPTSLPAHIAPVPMVVEPQLPSANHPYNPYLEHIYKIPPHIPFHPRGLKLEQEILVTPKKLQVHAVLGIIYKEYSTYRLFNFITYRDKQAFLLIQQPNIVNLLLEYYQYDPYVLAMKDARVTVKAQLAYFMKTCHEACTEIVNKRGEVSIALPYVLPTFYPAISKEKIDKHYQEHMAAKKQSGRVFIEPKSLAMKKITFFTYPAQSNSNKQAQVENQSVIHPQV